MAQKLKNNKNYIILILICVLALVLMIVGNLLNTDSQNDNDKNNIEQENEVIKVIIDQQENENSQVNQNDKPEEKNEQPSEEKKPNEEENVNNQTAITNAKSKYYIKVNNQQNVVTVYQQDTKGEYTVPVKVMICSIGTSTPKSGVYKTSDKYTWRLLQGNVYGQYAVRITGHILFHSVPYTKKSKDSLEWWEYDKLGTKASLGCVRLTVEDAKWIYDNCEKGTQVEFYYDDNPGPLGKPTAKKISSYSDELKIWDPTDSDKSNPWKDYTEPVVKDEPEEVTQPEDVPVVIPPEETTPIPEQTPSESTEESEEIEESEQQTEQDEEIEVMDE